MKHNFLITVNPSYIPPITVNPSPLSVLTHCAFYLVAIALTFPIAKFTQNHLRSKERLPKSLIGLLVLTRPIAGDYYTDNHYLTFRYNDKMNSVIWIRWDADTGRPVASFGKDGRRSMAEGLLKEHKEKGGVISPAAPVIFKDLVIVGGMGEWRIPGNISAYDARTGERQWLFHLIPFPGGILFPAIRTGRRILYES
jgi:hypothetical protein